MNKEEYTIATEVEKLIEKLEKKIEQKDNSYAWYFFKRELRNILTKYS